MIEQEPPFAPIGPLPTYESYSSLSTYEACPRRYAFRYVERLPGGERPSFFALGSAFHRAFEVCVRDWIAAGRPAGRLDTRMLWDAFVEAAATEGLPADEVERLRPTAEHSFGAFATRLAASQSEPAGTEVGFGFPVAIGEDGEPVRFVGYIDRVDRAPDGSTEIIDYKGGRIASQAQADANRQLSAYAYAVANGAVRGADGVTMPPASRLALQFTDADVVVWTTRDKLALAEFEAWLIGLVTGIRGRLFDPHASETNCRWCDYRTTCPAAPATP